MKIGEPHNTIITITTDQAKVFADFQKHLAFFLILKEAGVFNLRNGSAKLNFDNEGTLSGVEVEASLYRRGKPIVQSISQKESR